MNTRPSRPCSARTPSRFPLHHVSPWRIGGWAVLSHGDHLTTSCAGAISLLCLGLDLGSIIPRRRVENSHKSALGVLTRTPFAYPPAYPPPKYM